MLFSFPAPLASLHHLISLSEIRCILSATDVVYPPVAVKDSLSFECPAADAVCCVYCECGRDTLNFAGVRYDGTTASIKADPVITRNIHQIEVHGDGFVVIFDVGDDPAMYSPGFSDRFSDRS